MGPKRARTERESSTSHGSHEATVCQTCGDKGEMRLLIDCVKCRESAVHHYCLEIFSIDDDNITWMCEECAPKVVKFSPFRKSERIKLRKDQYGKVQTKWMNKLVKECSSLTGNTETPTSTSDCSPPCEEVKDLHSDAATSGNQVLEKQTRIFVDVDSPEEDFESVKVEASSLVSYGLSRPCQESDKYVGNQELRKGQRRFWLKDGDSSEDELESDVPEASSALHGPLNVWPPSRESDNYVHAQPIFDPIWGGSFNITNEKYKINLRLVAHLFSKACYKVSNAASVLPQELDVEILPKRGAWPKAFQTSPPTDDNIALYIFPKSERDEKVFDNLLDKIIERNLALKTVVDDVELLVFSSLELPQEHWRFRRKHYMWGVFSHKQYRHSIMQNCNSKYEALPKHTIHTVRQSAKGLPKSTRLSLESLSSCSSTPN